MKRAAVLLITLLAGCDLYWHNSGDDVVCNGGYGGGVAGAPAYEVRDPSTGICSYYDGGGGGGCVTDSNGCCQAVPIAEPAQPAGPYCSGACEGLDENSCTTTAGCHAEYEELNVAYPAVTDNNGSPVAFVQCWDIEPYTPLEGGGCAALDAITCAQHDDCVSIMDGTGTYDASGNMTAGSFVQCGDESTNIPPDSCAGVDCGVGSTCEQQCYPCDPSGGSTGCMSQCYPMCVPDQTCAGVDCGPGYTCGESCDASTGVCGPACYPTGPGDPGSCTGTITCGEPAPLCPAGTTAGIANGCYTDFCIPTNQCGPSDPGSCDPGGVMCNIAPPSCPANTVPGVVNGCWSGFCIPQSECPPAACETLTNEMACEARPDCTPVYNGMGCTCDADGVCSCQSETYARCETLYVTDPPTPVGPPTPVMN